MRLDACLIFSLLGSMLWAQGERKVPLSQSVGVQLAEPSERRLSPYDKSRIMESSNQEEVAPHRSSAPVSPDSTQVVPFFRPSPQKPEQL
ncbi:MAG: hypothetical protein RMK19_00305 [Bacteroidia bacterium]|nr:hypothetical protein [Bacteroidia bacterium]MDW8014438.1 hypothetical protein [Bacteroidia bacterium]